MRRFAGGDFGFVSQQLFLVRLHFFFPVFGQNVVQNGAVEFGFFGFVHGGKAGFPRFAVGFSANAGGAPFVQNGFGDFKRSILEAQAFAGGKQVFRADGRTVDFAGAFFRRAVADDGMAGDQGRLVGFFGARDGGFDLVGVVRVAFVRVPAVRFKAFALVGRSRDRCRTVDRDFVVVPQNDHFVQAQMSRQRNRFFGDAFHQAAVAADDISVVVDDFFTEAGGKQFFRDRHADGGGNALTQRSRRGFDSFQMTVFGVTRAARTQLAEAFQLIQRRLFIARQIQQAVQQHRTVSRGQDETVAIRPMRGFRVEFQEFREQNGGDVRHAHRHAGVTRIGFLDAFGSQETNGVRHIFMRNHVSSESVIEKNFSPLYHICARQKNTSFKKRRKNKPSACRIS